MLATDLAMLERRDPVDPANAPLLKAGRVLHAVYEGLTRDSDVLDELEQLAVRVLKGRPAAQRAPWLASTDTDREEYLIRNLEKYLKREIDDALADGSLGTAKGRATFIFSACAFFVGRLPEVLGSQDALMHRLETALPGEHWPPGWLDGTRSGSELGRHLLRAFDVAEKRIKSFGKGVAQRAKRKTKKRRATK